jgi:rare lipoprotein A (peptidoglycan hydrolase)
MEYAERMKHFIFAILATAFFAGSVALAQPAMIIMPGARQESEQKMVEPEKGPTAAGNISWYGEAESECIGCHPQRLMACTGKRFDENALTIAAPVDRKGRPVIACGTEVEIRANGRSVTAIVTDTGGFAHYGRKADVSKGVARALGFLSQGVVYAELYY